MCNESFLCLLVLHPGTECIICSSNDPHPPSVTMPDLMPVCWFLQHSQQERMPTGQSEQLKHGAGLSTATSCQKSTIKPRAGSYITYKNHTHTNQETSKRARTTEVKQELLQHSNPFWADGINSCLSYCAPSRMQLLIWRKFFFVLWDTESVQALANTIRAANVKNIFFHFS